jgi:hypothetical protein
MITGPDDLGTAENEYGAHNMKTVADALGYRRKRVRER